MRSGSPFEKRKVKELMALAKQAKVAGWYEMRKSELITALARAAAEKQSIRREVPGKKSVSTTNMKATVPAETGKKGKREQKTAPVAASSAGSKKRLSGQKSSGLPDVKPGKDTTAKKTPKKSQTDSGGNSGTGRGKEKDSPKAKSYLRSKNSEPVKSKAATGAEIRNKNQQGRGSKLKDGADTSKVKTGKSADKKMSVDKVRKDKKVPATGKSRSVQTARRELRHSLTLNKSTEVASTVSVPATSFLPDASMFVESGLLIDVLKKGGKTSLSTAGSPGGSTAGSSDDSATFSSRKKNPGAAAVPRTTSDGTASQVGNSLKGKTETAGLSVGSSAGHKSDVDSKNDVPEEGERPADLLFSDSGSDDGKEKPSDTALTNGEPSDGTADDHELPSFVTPIPRKPTNLKDRLLLYKTLGSEHPDREVQDQIILMVRDPYWLHAYWEISSRLVERIRAAMGHLWHTADPILRLFRIFKDNTDGMRREFVSDVAIRGGVNNWYIDVDDPPSSFLVEIGYLARDNQFFTLMTSNIVETPQCYIHDAFGHPDAGWMGIPSDICSGAFSGERSGLRNGFVNRDFSGSAKTANRPSALEESDAGRRKFNLQVDAEVVVKGKTDPTVQLNIKGEGIRLKEDGSFSVRYHLPERRHVFPIVAISEDGIETQTVILAVERNTKILETVIKEDDDE